MTNGNQAEGVFAFSRITENRESAANPFHQLAQQITRKILERRWERALHYDLAFDRPLEVSSKRRV